MGPSPVLVFCLTILQCLNVYCGAAESNPTEQMRKFCLVLALPGKIDGLDMKDFKTIYDKELEKIGSSVFGNIPAKKRIEEAAKQCRNTHDTSNKCTYLRLYRIRDILIQDLSKLKEKVKTNTGFTPLKYSPLLSAWYLDKVFLNLRCGPVNDKTYIPVQQWTYFAELSNKLSSKKDFCSLFLVFGRDVTMNLRREVKTICELSRTEPICQLTIMFDIIDTLSNMCDGSITEVWDTSSPHYNTYQDAAKIIFYALRSRAPANFKNSFHKSIKQDAIKESMLRTLSVFNDKFKTGDLILPQKMLTLLPKGLYLPCDFTAKFPSMEYLNCAFAKIINQIRSYIINYWQKSKSANALIRKGVDSNIDYREYIKNVRATNIMQMIEKTNTNLDVVATDIKNNVQDRFKQLGKYFRKVANFDLKKRNADVDYLKQRIDLYRINFSKLLQSLVVKMYGMMMLNTLASYADLRQSITKLAMRIAMGGNPLKWLTGSGNADDILESATEVAQAGLNLAKALKKFAGFKELEKYSGLLSTKLKSNQALLKNIDKVLNKSRSPDENFEAQKEEFLKLYASYTPAVRKDELDKLRTFWEEFIGSLCDSIENTNSIFASVLKGISVAVSGPNDLCVSTKSDASALVTSLEEIYDFQFELVEQMAAVIQSINQIQSSEILGSGLRAKNPGDLDTKDIKTIAAASSISYAIVQSVNVYMLCNAMEYERGGNLPEECNGLATDIDRLLSLKSPTCYPAHEYVSVPTTPRSDQSWIDMSKLYNNELVQFRIPNSQWLVDNGWIENYQRDNAFYVQEFEVYFPVRSERRHKVTITVTPVTAGVKLYDNSRTLYTLSNTEQMKMSYATGQNFKCRQNRITNPYVFCQSGPGKTVTKPCPVSLQVNPNGNKQIVYSSIYSRFHIKVNGYKDDHLDVPMSNFSLKLGIKFCHVVPREINRRHKRDRQRLDHLVVKRKAGNDRCCTDKTKYYDEKRRSCEPCPPGSKPLYNGLFCGGVVKLMATSNVNETYTYEKAVDTCKQKGSKIATESALMEARKLRSEDCICGWIDGKKINSPRERTKCKGKAACPSANDIKHVYCTTKYYIE